MDQEFIFRAEIWLHEGAAAWHFVTLPKSVGLQIKALRVGSRNPFGSVKVVATLGQTTWKTSIFPDNKRESYVLPVKSFVRQREQLPAGIEVEVVIRMDGED
jgi:hypothetical protein